MGKDALKPSSKSGSKVPSKPKSKSAPKATPKASPILKSATKTSSIDPTAMIWIPGRYLRPLAEFYCINEACKYYSMPGLGNMYHHTWCGGIDNPNRLIKCKECNKSFVETKWPFPAMPTPVWPPIEIDSDFAEEVLSARKRGNPKKAIANIHVILDPANEDEVELKEKLAEIEKKIEDDFGGGRRGLFKYIAKVLLVRWSKG